MGIDPGTSGGYGVIDEHGKVVEVITTPYEKLNYVLEDIFSFINKYPISVVVVEDIHAIFGTSKGSMFKMGEGVGIIKAALHCQDLTPLLVAPKKWQKAIWIDSDIVFKKEKNGEPALTKVGKPKIDTKGSSLAAATRLFPGETFLATKRSSVPHDGIVDALLLAEYGRRQKF